VARYVHGAARALAETRAATSETGVGEDEWWQARSGMLAEVAPDYGERFPTLTRLAREGSFDVDPPEVSGMSYLETEALDTFEFGLARMLDGVAVLISGR
jgi:hypothetical protein